MDALLLLLLDSRSPAGAHNHSAGMEAAVARGLVQSMPDVEAFCGARLRTSGRLAAQAAASACAGPADWAALEAEFDARTPSEAVRTASHALGRGLLRLVRAMLPAFDPPPTTHHPLVLGAAVAAAGGSPGLAARAAALGTVSVPASAAVRLLGLDPFAVQAMLARLAATIDAGGVAAVPPAQWTAAALPALDLLADHHLTTEVRLFAS